MTHAQLTVRNGVPAVRLSAKLPVPAGRLWSQALTPTGLTSWFPFEVEFEPKVGAEVSFIDPNDTDQVAFTGEITSLRDPEELGFTFGGPNTVHITLSSDGRETTLALVEQLGNENEAARNAAGWHMAVSKLERIHGVDSPELDWGTLYERYVDEGFPVGAPVPGIDDSTIV